MSFVKKYQHFGAKTFDQLLSCYIARFMQIKPVGYTLINLVGDRYDFDGQCTLKGDERQRRKQYEKVREFHPSDGQFRDPKLERSHEESQQRGKLA